MEGLHGILATNSNTGAAALSAISTLGAVARPREPGLLLALRPPIWTFHARRIQDSVINKHMPQAAFTSMLNGLLCNHICGILNPNLNC